MTETLIRAQSTDATGPFGIGLQLFERALDIHESAEAEDMPTLGSKDQVGPILMVRHWPRHMWLIGEHLAPTDGVIDISHGYAVLRLRGPGALLFLADYTSADLRSFSVRSAGTVRCALGPYAVVLWWDITRDIRIAIERSIAQSLVDHLKLLVQRRGPLDHLD